jgi:hypothetical protein
MVVAGLKGLGFRLRNKWIFATLFYKSKSSKVSILNLCDSNEIITKEIR